MKTFLLILIASTISFSCAAVSDNKLNTSEKPIPIETSIDRDYTYEGRLDPTDFNNWSGAPYQEGPYGMVYILQNPRKNAAIKFAFVYLATNNTIVSFAYIEDNKLRYFGIVRGTHYEEIDIPEKVSGEIKQNLLIMEESFDRSFNN